MKDVESMRLFLNGALGNAMGLTMIGARITPVDDSSKRLLKSIEAIEDACCEAALALQQYERRDDEKNCGL